MLIVHVQAPRSKIAAAVVCRTAACAAPPTSASSATAALGSTAAGAEGGGGDIELLVCELLVRCDQRLDLVVERVHGLAALGQSLFDCRAMVPLCCVLRRWAVHRRR